MTLHVPFDNSYARLPEGFFTSQAPTPVRAPEMIIFNHALASELGLSGVDSPDLAQVFAGNLVPDGAAPLAQLYAGHQFGHFNPQLGDGRALLLGEVIDTQAQRRDIQLKGSGPTPYSRMGDGRAWLGPVLREYLVSEAMHAMGVPTTRALAAVRSGDTVLREAPLPGAVLTRVAASHLRVGTFQVFLARRDLDSLQTLYNYARDRHAADAADPHDFLDRVIARQASLVAQWMGLGFVHGVMNTDNCTISGETIDFGPCAFLDHYDPSAVFSSIDQFGRYGYSAQADIIVWNMAQLATCFVPLMPDGDAAVARFTDQIHAMPDLIRGEWLRVFAAKLGITHVRAEDTDLVTDLLDMMAADKADFTNTFRALGDDLARDHFLQRDAFDAWQVRWQRRISTEPDAAQKMARTNPAIIPRNHQIEAVIAAAVDGDDAPFHRLLSACTQPFDEGAQFADLRRPPGDGERVTATFCGT